MAVPGFWGRVYSGDCRFLQEVGFVMIDALRNVLYLLSNALLPPTLLSIILLAAWTAILIGGIVREWMTRGQVRRMLLQIREASRGAAMDRRIAWKNAGLRQMPGGS